MPRLRHHRVAVTLAVCVSFFLLGLPLCTRVSCLLFTSVTSSGRRQYCFLLVMALSVHVVVIYFVTLFCQVGIVVSAVWFLVLCCVVGIVCVPSCLQWLYCMYPHCTHTLLYVLFVLFIMYEMSVQTILFVLIHLLLKVSVTRLVQVQVFFLRKQLCST